jgi:hypothetical protein
MDFIFEHFEQYNIEELEECGPASKEKYPAKREIGTREWTNEVLTWFAERCPQERCFFSHGGEEGECLVDLCHTTLPRRKSKERHIEWWGRALKRPCKCWLALESEWGRKWSEETSLSAVLEDAWKLAILRAEVKVMIFASQAGDNRRRILTALQDLRKAANDQAPWLWIDVPWRDASGVPQTICCDLFWP